MKTADCLRIWMFSQIFYLTRSHSHSPIGVEAIYILVIVEVAVAFSIGILCIIFSFNLLRAVSDSDPANLNSGDLPRSRSTTLIRRHSRGQQLNTIQRQSNGDLTKVNSNGEHPTIQLPVGRYQPISGNPLDYDSEFETESIDTEDRRGFAAIMRSFTDYLRVW